MAFVCTHRLPLGYTTGPDNVSEVPPKVTPLLLVPPGS